MIRAALFVFVAMACMGMTTKPAPAPPNNDVAANKKLVSDMFQMLFVEHKVDQAIDTYFDPGYIQHNPSAANGAETIRTVFKAWYTATPSATAELKRIICEGDLCAVHSHNIPKPGDRGSAVVDIFRIANGKIAEHWDVGQPVPEKSANNNTMF